MYKSLYPWVKWCEIKSRISSINPRESKWWGSLLTHIYTCKLCKLCKWLKISAKLEIGEKNSHQNLSGKKQKKTSAKWWKKFFFFFLCVFATTFYPCTHHLSHNHLSSLTNTSTCLHLSWGFLIGKRFSFLCTKEANSVWK